MVRTVLLPLVGLACAGLGVACDGLLGVDFSDANAMHDAGVDASPGGDSNAPADDPDVPLVPASKVDLLLVVDNSSSMSDKSKLLAGSIGTLIRDVARVGDLHVGVITSSLGNFGGDVCPKPTETNRTDDRAYLRRTNEQGQTVTTSGVVSFKGGDVERTVKDVEAIVRGVGEDGCGLEAQLEATYRFLVQPDPWMAIRLDGYGMADLGSEVDTDLLAQRKAFLRPDSALVVVLITDEDDSSADPLSVGGQGWAFMAKSFPGSNVFRGTAAQGTTAPRGTSICATDAASPDCTSCGFQDLCDATTSMCQKIRDDPNCKRSGVPGQSGRGFNGYYGPMEESLNVRFHRMKERFGIDPQYPIGRYVAGFTSSKVPDRTREHAVTDSNGYRIIADYKNVAACTNPIFAAALPENPTTLDELCNLPRGPRSRELVLFAVLGGLPETLATETPDWTQILGVNPDAYDYSGIDAHMIPSISPRSKLPGPSTTPGDNGTDPVHGREWDTGGDDLQYACTFTLAEPRQCSPNEASCDCGGGTNPPLCGTKAGEQIKAKAYPTTRPLRVVKNLGERGIVGSICASAGYDATMRVLAERLRPRLAR